MVKKNHHLARDVDREGGFARVGWGVCKLSVPSAQFHYGLKTSLKIKVRFLKINSFAPIILLLATFAKENIRMNNKNNVCLMMKYYVIIKFCVFNHVIK